MQAVSRNLRIDFSIARIERIQVHKCHAFFLCQALQLAVEDAMAKAEVMANAAGRSLGGIVEINEGGQQDDYYNSSAGSARYAESAAGAMDVGTTVRAAQVKVTASVGITYAMASE